jgi:hypothetical protein
VAPTTFAATWEAHCVYSTYDLAFQWVRRDGPFHYDFQSLTGNVQNEAMETWVKNDFKPDLATTQTISSN